MNVLIIVLAALALVAGILSFVDARINWAGLGVIALAIIALVGLV